MKYNYYWVSLNVKSNFSNNPRWLWESVAIYEFNEHIDPNDISYMSDGNYPSISELNGDFNKGNYKIYEIGFLLAEYIISTWEDNAYLNLMKGLGNINHMLGITVNEFENGWHDFIENKYFGQTDIPSQKNNDLTLFHNIDNKLLYLSLKNRSTISGVLQIIDMNGKIILDKPIGENTLITNLDSFKPGVCAVSINIGDLYFCEKIVMHSKLYGSQMLGQLYEF